VAWLTSFRVSHSILSSGDLCLNGEQYTRPKIQRLPSFQKLRLKCARAMLISISLIKEGTITVSD
jgi:hypothetical protein